jgi:transketolase
MRDAFIAELTEIARRDPSTMLVTADLGFGVLANFAKEMPGQYINVGVAEQNMAGIAAGLALDGHRVFTYSIGNFPTLRCVEQIRNCICYHNLPVTVVTVGGGFAYGPLGFSHHATEDVAVMSALPGMRVMSPNDPLEAIACTAFAGVADGPSYLRLGRNSDRQLHRNADVRISEGKLVRVAGAAQSSIAIIGGCGALDVAVDAAALLAAAGTTVSVWSSPFITPFDSRTVERLARDTDAVVTMEEHSLYGGLGTRVAHAMAAIPGARAQHIAVGVPPLPQHQVGDQTFMRDQVGLDARSAAERIMLACPRGLAVSDEVSKAV